MNKYIQDKLDEFKSLRLIDNQEADGIIDDNTKLSDWIEQSFIDYHNHILEKIEMLKRKHYNETAFMNHRNDYNDAHNEVLQSVLSLLQDTNKDNV